MTDAPVAPGTTVPAAPAPRSRRLYEIDVLRILTFACVIAVHTISNTAPFDDLALYGLLTLVHFTREVFFALTAFVLLYGQLARPVSMRAFWPKRFLLVGVPYVVWSAIYELVSLATGEPLPGLVGRFLLDLVTGNAWYHLYFLLVTMQVYLLVPAIIWFVKKTRGHHRTVLIVSFVLQLGLTAFYQYGHDSALSAWERTVFISYQFFIIAGAIAADHAAAFLAWVRSHRTLITWAVVVSAALTLVVFGLQHALLNRTLTSSADPLQPVIMVWSVCVGLGLLAIGTWWADRRRSGSRIARAVDVVSDRSFGIFLSHPLVIWVATWSFSGWLPKHLGAPWLTIVVYLLAAVGAFVIADLSRRTPFSLPLAGRRFVSTRTSTAASGPPPSTAPAA